MHLIKLNAIDSTNDYLKALTSDGKPDDFTTVYADYQQKGRGQMGSSWQSEPGKNLTMSTLVANVIERPHEIYMLNAAVTVAIINALTKLNMPRLAVKWPNDIMAGNRKLGGVLIENAFRHDGSISSVIGIGLNVNQEFFVDLPNATSMFLETGSVFDREELAINIVSSLKPVVSSIRQSYEQVWQQYKSNLFRAGIPTMFEDASGKFMAIITDVAADGRLVLSREDESIVFYGIKEVQMLY